MCSNRFVGPKSHLHWRRIHICMKFNFRASVELVDKRWLVQEHRITYEYSGYADMNLTLPFGCAVSLWRP